MTVRCIPSPVIFVTPHMARRLSASFMVSPEEIAPKPAPPIQRVRKRGKVMCWRTQKGCAEYRRWRAHELKIAECHREMSAALLA